VPELAVQRRSDDEHVRLTTLDRMLDLVAERRPGDRLVGDDEDPALVLGATPLGHGDGRQLTRFPAEELLVAGVHYYTASGSLPTTRETQSNLNVAANGHIQHATGAGTTAQKKGAQA
jgi:hypothetical protein